MTSFGYRSNPRYAIKECSSCGTLYTRDCVCSIGTVEDKILVPKLPKNYARCTRCGYLVDVPNCQGCALLRQEHEENLVTHSPDFQNTSEPSNASTNVVNVPREPYVVKQDNGNFVDKIIFDLNRAPDSPNQFHCFHCKDVLRDEEAFTPTEPIDSLSMRDEHLDTILATESDEFIKSCVENLVPNPSESEGENGCDVLACFTTFSNVLFDDDYDSDSSNDQLLSDEDVREKIYSNLLFDEEIIPMKIDSHSFNAESNLIESTPNHDSSVIISSKIDSLFDEFIGELTLLKSFLSGIDENDCHPEKEIRLTKRLLYDNSSPRPPKEIVFDKSHADIESFSPSPIPNKDIKQSKKEGQKRTQSVKPVQHEAIPGRFPNEA
nr:hypothetical protein [Tanacetum cinerariifolium]